MKILIVEDNILNQKTLRLLLNRDNHECDVVSNGLQAVNAVAHGTYALVLMDIMMPIMDGIQATVEIRKFNANIPIVAVTALEIDEFKDRAFSAGMNDYITKPIDRTTLREKLVQWGSFVLKRDASTTGGTKLNKG